MNIQSSKRLQPRVVEPQRAAPLQSSGEQQQEPKDSFLQNVGQFVEGAIPVLGALPAIQRSETEDYNPSEFAAIFMGQTVGCYFGLLAGMRHAGGGFQGAALGYGIAGIGLLASGYANAHANHASFT